MLSKKAGNGRNLYLESYTLLELSSALGRLPVEYRSIRASGAKGLADHGARDCTGESRETGVDRGQEQTSHSRKAERLDPERRADCAEGRNVRFKKEF